MKTYKDRENNLVNLTEKSDIDTKMDKNTTEINELPTSFYDTSFLFKVGQDITIGNVTIPTFSRGIFISNGNSNDLVMIAVCPSKNVYIGFRNNMSWGQIRKI